MRIMIASLRFSPGHIAHLIAYYQIAQEMKYSVVLFVDKRYEAYLKPFNLSILNDYEQASAWKPDTIIAYNSSFDNLKLARLFKHKSHLLNVIHEPYPGIKKILIGKTFMHIGREMIRDTVDFITCKAFDQVILPSEHAKNAYMQYSKICNDNYRIFPLLFPDFYEQNQVDDKRKYFSFIGLFTALHGNERFIEFLHYIEKNKLNIPCKIVTSSNITYLLKDMIVNRMAKNGQLVIVQGKPLTIEVINRHYRESICVWNVYEKSMQSGVIGNSLMMGTPVVASRVGSFEEHVIEGETGYFIDNPSDIKQIVNLYYLCLENQQKLVNSCRDAFLKTFYYGVHKEAFKLLIEGVG